MSRREVLLAGVLARRPDDEAHSFRSQALDDLAQAAALFVGADAPRHAHPTAGRGEHEVPTRDGDMGGDPRALGADRFLGDLDHDLLPLREQGVDARDRATAVAPPPSSPSAVLRRVFQVVPRVEEGGPCRARCRRTPPASRAAPGSPGPLRYCRRRSARCSVRSGARRGSRSQGARPGFPRVPR